MNQRTLQNSNMTAGTAQVYPVKRPALKPSVLIIRIVVLFVVLVWLIPLIGLVINSFRPFTDATGSGWWTVFINPKFDLSNYKAMLGMQNLSTGLINSVLITFPTTLGVVLVCASAAYVFTLTDFPGRLMLFAFVTGLIIIPPEITLYPTLVILKMTHLVNTYPGVWMSYIASTVPFGVFLLGSFMIQIPRELLNAAKIDGAKTRHMLFNIVLPLSGPAIASLAIFDFLWVWNDLLRALIIIPDSSIRPLTAVLANSAGGYGEYITVQAAGAVLLMLPPLIVFLTAQKAFVNGVMAGAIKS